MDKKKIERISDLGKDKVGKAVKNIFQFTTDSLGLIVLKRTENKDLAYKIITRGRKFANSMEKVTQASIKTSGHIIGGIVEVATSDKVKARVGSIQDTISHRAKKMDEDYKRSEELKEIKAKISRMIKEKMDEAKDLEENTYKEITEEIKEDI